MQLVIIILTFLSLTSFMLWSRPYGDENTVKILRVISYYAGPIHIALSLPIYALFVINNGVVWGWYSIAICTIILANIIFYAWAYSKFEGGFLNVTYNLADYTNLGIITIVPNGFAIFSLMLVQVS